MAHKIAILTSRDVYYNYGDNSQRIVESITGWEEVSDTDYKILCGASSRLGFVILEQPIYAAKFIAKTIADYKAIVEADAIRLKTNSKNEMRQHSNVR
jgi:RsiW-degrading membrane proteinase PrsW (M82 family)